MKAMQQMPHQQEDWSGYSLEEIRYRRAYLGARKELEKERLLHHVSAIKTGAGSSAMNVVHRVSSGIPLLNYGLLAYTIGSRAWKILRHIPFRKKKRK